MKKIYELVGLNQIKSSTKQNIFKVYIVVIAVLLLISLITDLVSMQLHIQTIILFFIGIIPINLLMFKYALPHIKHSKELSKHKSYLLFQCIMLALGFFVTMLLVEEIILPAFLKESIHFTFSRIIIYLTLSIMFGILNIQVKKN